MSLPRKRIGACALAVFVLLSTGVGYPGLGAEPMALKTVVQLEASGPNLLSPEKWWAWGEGFVREGDQLVCDNGSDGRVQRGAGQTIELNQSAPSPIVAEAWSRAENVGGSVGADYSLYLDITYADGTPLWGQSGAFDVGTHDWQKREVVVWPEKPVKSVHAHVLMRGHSGKAWFKDISLRAQTAPEGACLFDGYHVAVKEDLKEGIQVFDAKAGDGIAVGDGDPLGLRIMTSETSDEKASFLDVTVSDESGQDRAITVYYAIPVGKDGVTWLEDAYTVRNSEPFCEVKNVIRFPRIGGGALSRYPFGAVISGSKGVGLGIDMDHPAFYRIGYSAGTGELYLAYDLGLTTEKPAAHVRLCRFEFDPAWGFRAALDQYQRLFPAHFECRAKKQGIWMPFAPISAVEGWEDFGFGFKEGDGETAWDDAHDIVTFRYTEPMTWWMPMPKEMPRTYEAAVQEARRLANEGNPAAKALLTSGFHDEEGKFLLELHDTPWCNGAVWSMNSMPGIAGDVTDFKIKWNADIREKLYGASRTADLDGEYIDSSEGYVTKELDFRREHFAAADTPLTFSSESKSPCIFRGLIAFEYARGIARDVHGLGKLMMANATPWSLCWLTPQLDVLGTETNWNPGGQWQPMSVGELFYRRALCKGKPYCFLMNTSFDGFSHELVEKFMKRSVAFGMFPGFFSADASTGHYFSRPELYNRDRDLFKKYVPVCRAIAEAGWEPVTLARADNPDIALERFGATYLTVFNPAEGEKSFSVHFESAVPTACREMLSDKPIEAKNGQIGMALGGEDVAVLELKAR